MKSIKNRITGEYKRVKDEDADKMISVRQSSWSYVSKTEWKTNTRPKKIEKD
jgi:hypothetical protein